MKKVLQQLFEHKTLSASQAKEVLIAIGKSQYNEHEITAFTTVYLMRSITIEELQGFRAALLELCVPVDMHGLQTIDIVGTGGDGKNTFNISTLACFIVAGTGHKVTKHGNYGATSISGASNVMEQLGYRFKNENEALVREVSEANICFLHAPLFHPALKIVGPIRKNLGIRTFFNMLGPLVNPARPAYQLIGVYNAELSRIYNYILQQEKSGFTIINSLDGYDEISLTADIKIITRQGEKIATPEEVGKRMVSPTDISGGNSVEDAAKIFMKILKGEGSFAQNAVVLANAAMALHGISPLLSYDEAYNMAVDSLESGKSYTSFQKINFSAMSHILDTIVIAKQREVQALHQQFWVSDFEKMPGYQRTPVSLSKRLQQAESTGIIAEFKRKSPSKGFFTLPNTSVQPVVEAYAQQAAGISILTDAEFFGGALKDLQMAAAAVSVPLLRKDFIIDPLQIHQAKAFGADVILLIAAILTPAQVKTFATLANNIGLEILLEIHDETELAHICDEVDMMGVNNRNLQTFEVNINTSLQLIKQLPSQKSAISESGISNIESIITLQQAGFRGFLIGEHFMRQPDPAIAFTEFIYLLSQQKIREAAI